ncbi:MAG: FAD-dependent monooxygenase, partial [Deltaproteobacteria bacterium]|nr:FAD-dependent monooxygenase [Deltaproteobacteria bacterium]
MLTPESAGRKINLVGAGPVGSLLAIYLARRGFQVEMFEGRPDMRRENISAGRSINLAVSTRGLHALAEIGLEAEVLKQAVQMPGRMIHALDGTLTFQPYGMNDSQCINSISRGGLNKTLMTRAEETGKVKIHFSSKIDGLELFAENEVVIGTDGSASAVRAELLKYPGFASSREVLDYGYKELIMPPAPGGGFSIEKNALHIWPRGTFMLIALPNFDGSFTCTLFLPFKGVNSFERLVSPIAVQDFFEANFRDALPLIPDLEEDFFTNPTGQMVTVKCAPWNLGGRALLMGDAAHAIVPFFGQGMNCGFEDCSVLNGQIDRHDTWASLFGEVTRLRKSNADAIADMAVENFIEMRDKVGNQQFLLEKNVEKLLQTRFAGEYVSRYSLVTFSRVPYRLAYDAGVIQAEILGELC